MSSMVTPHNEATTPDAVQGLPLSPDADSPGNPDKQVILECSNWLSFHRVWGELNDQTLQAIAQSLQLLKVNPGTEIYREGLAPLGLYLLKWGSVEIYHLSPVARPIFCTATLASCLAMFL